jgi:hypothetical protein
MWINLLLLVLLLLLFLLYRQQESFIDIIPVSKPCKVCDVQRGGMVLEAGMPLYEERWLGGGYYEGPYGRYPDDQPLERRARWPWQILS